MFRLFRFIRVRDKCLVITVHPHGKFFDKINMIPKIDDVLTAILILISCYPIYPPVNDCVESSVIGRGKK